MAEKYLTNNPSIEIDKTVGAINPDRILIVTDKNVERKVLPLLADSEVITRNPIVSIIPGESEKNLDTVIKVWNKLEEIRATRNSLIINIGGGVVTDLGGFAAATFKRGIKTINFPTTVLGAVDAATGGKTGIDYHGLKNEIGAFHLPEKVILSTLPFSSLPKRELLSGYAEMIKTALISDRPLYITLLDIDGVIDNEKLLGKSVEKCVRIKDDVVAQDPREKGLRKILNFGHTAGHAFESLRILLGREVTHGEAVAHGILVALILSNMKFGFPSVEVNFYRNFLKANYGESLITCNQMLEILKIMAYDKKNQQHGKPLFTLLKEIGEPVIDIHVTTTEISEALEIYLDLVH